MRPHDWRVRALNAAIADIKTAEFVALDLEFTGLFRERHPCVRLERHYELCAGDCKSFMVVQLGVCPVRRASLDDMYLYGAGRDDRRAEDTWIMNPYNFYIFPFGKRVMFTSDSNAFQFLHEQGFSFDKLLADGFDYARLGDLADKRVPHSRGGIRVRQEGAQRLIEEVTKSGKPIVLHNGFLDMLHLFHRFVNDLPPGLPEFCAEWLRIFSGGLFDTRYIASEGCNSWFGLGHSANYRLHELARCLLKKGYQSQLVVQPRFATGGTPPWRITESYSLRKTDGSGSSKCHEAGYDALVTAHVFLMQAEVMLAGLAATAEGGGGPCIPSQWLQTPQFGARFRNTVAILNVSPGRLNISQAALLKAATPPSVKRLREGPTDEEAASASTAAASDPEDNSVRNFSQFVLNDNSTF